MPEFVSQAAYARHRGWSPARVSQLKKETRLVLNDAGQIDVEATDALLAELSDPHKQGVVERHARDRGDRAITAATDPESAPAHQRKIASSGLSEDRQQFQSAQADKERELATLTRLRREELEGVLVRKDDVKRFWDSAAAVITKGLMGMEPRIMPLINGESDAAKRSAILEREVRACLNEFADLFDAMAKPAQ